MWYPDVQAEGNEIQSSATSVRANFSSHAPSPDFECGCCFSSTSWPQKVSCASDHGFCRECVQRYVNHVISGEGSSLFACLSDGCQAPFPSAQLHFLDPNLLKRLEERRQSEEVGKALADCDDGQIFQCPSCEFKCLIPESNKVMECLNPKCLKDSCKLCKEDWDKHFGLPCDEVEAKGESDLRVRTEEAMTNAVVRRCIKCNAPFVKEAGNPIEIFRLLYYRQPWKLRADWAHRDAGFDLGDTYCLSSKPGIPIPPSSTLPR